MSLPVIELVPMSDAKYEAWIDRSTREYAAQHVATGNWPEAEALDRARAEFDSYLPQGLATPDNEVWTIVDVDGADVGMLWVARHARRLGHAFVYEIWIEPSRRGEGLAKSAMIGLEEWAQHNGISSIGLHVFGGNTVARALYQRLGYVETNVNMEKRLG